MSTQIRKRKGKVASQIQEPAHHRVSIGGKPNGNNAGDERTDDGGLSRVLSEAEAVEKRAKCQNYAVLLSPLAIKVIADTIGSHDRRLRFSAATKLCEIAGVVQSGGIEHVLETTAAADQRRNDERLRFLGSYMDMMMNKSDLYKMPPSPEFAKDSQELNDKIQELARQSPSDEEQLPLPSEVQASSSPPNKRGRRV